MNTPTNPTPCGHDPLAVQSSAEGTSYCSACEHCDCGMVDWKHPIDCGIWPHTRKQRAVGEDPDQWRSRKTTSHSPLANLGPRAVREFMARVLTHQYRKAGR